MSCANNFLSGGTTPFKALSDTCDKLLAITSPLVCPFMQLQSLDDAHSPLIQSHGADTAPLCHHLYINIPRHLGSLGDISTLGIDSAKINQCIFDY